MPIHVTGNPRSDLLRPELRGFYQGEVEALRKTHGDFILMNTNFNHVNAFYPGLNLFKPVKRPGERARFGRAARGMSRDYAEGLPVDSANFKASASNTGLLSNLNWSTFNAKQDAISNLADTFKYVEYVDTNSVVATRTWVDTNDGGASDSTYRTINVDTLYALAAGNKVYVCDSLTVLGKLTADNLFEIGDTTGFAAAAGQQRSPGTTGWLLLSPLILWAVAFVVAPAAIMLVYSFAHRGTLGGVVPGFTLENYAGVADPVYLRIVGRSIVYAGITTASVEQLAIIGGGGADALTVDASVTAAGLTVEFDAGGNAGDRSVAAYRKYMNSWPIT